MNLVKFDSLEAGITVATDKHGYEHVVVVAKATFTILSDGRCVLAQDQQPLVFADEYNGKPGSSSVRYESDFALCKPQTDIILNGSAHAPRGKPTTCVDVTLEVGAIHKTIRVFGDRTWKRSLLGGFAPSNPEPFLSIPLVYERAFGGLDQSHEDVKKHSFEVRNLVGAGFNARLHDEIAGTPLPNLEDPKHLISYATDKPRPMAFGFIARNWQPRASYAGTYDQAWLDHRFPFLPTDFEERHFQGAPDDQICDYLQGGELVRLSNLTPEGRLEFRLPCMAMPFKLVYTATGEDLRSVLDTIIIEPDSRRCIQLWRGSTRLRKKPTQVREVWVGTPSKGRQRALETGKAYIDWSKVYP